MTGRRKAIGLAGVTLVALAGSSRAQNGGRLPAILDSFKRQSTADQYKQVNGAIVSSPTLMRSLGAAADAGRLTGITIAEPSHKPNGPFRTTIENGRIVFASDMLPQLQPRRLMDAVLPEETLPNNLVFVLGAFAFHLQTPRSPQPPPPRSSDQTAYVMQFVQAQVERDARAFLEGWNDVVEAATHDNGNKPLTVPQFSSMMLNLRYRAVFIGKETMNKLQWMSSGRLEPNARNVAAVAEGLKTLKLLDFGVPPQLPR